MNLNSENPGVGRRFQEEAASILGEFFRTKFELEKPIPIGSPAKNHKFDCVSENSEIVAECKCYTWTDTGNVPSAKMTALNEAVFYLLFLPEKTIRFIVLKKAVYTKRHETLAEYYSRINNHLLGEVGILEIDDMQKVRIIREAGQKD